MNIEVTVTRTDSGARTQLRSENGEVNKDYSSWQDALREAEEMGLIGSAGEITANVMPPGLPLHTKAEADPSVFSAKGFVPGKTTPPQ
jgi:hypothetical protein